MNLQTFSDKYICSSCGEEFKAGQSDKEAEQEAKENFGVDNASKDEKMAVICDDCYKNLMRQLTN